MIKTILLLVLCVTLVSCLKVSSDVINDAQARLQWVKKIPAYEMDWETARNYCSNLKLNDRDDWRLPTRSELETTINPALKVSDENSKERPFHGPFILEMEGFLFSGTPAENKKDTHYLMRLDNGHTFLSSMDRAFVRCVRDQRFD